MSIQKLPKHSANPRRQKPANTTPTGRPKHPQSTPLITPTPRWRDGFQKPAQTPLYAAGHPNGAQVQGAQPAALASQSTPSMPPGVTGTYNLTTRELTLIDPSRIDPATGEPMRITGQFHSGDPNSTSYLDRNGHIPPGTYDILYHPQDGYFRLEPVDSNYGDDAVEGTRRGLLRLHGAGNSIGCITLEGVKDSPEAIREWDAIEQFIENAETDNVNIPKGGDAVTKFFRRALPWEDTNEDVVRYGRIEVIQGEKVLHRRPDSRLENS